MSKKGITYCWGKSSLTINIGNLTNKRVLWLYVFEFLFTSGVVAILLITTFPAGRDILQWVTGVGASLLYFLAARRFLLRLFYSEQIVVDDRYVTFIRKNLFAQRVRRCDWRLLGTLHYEGKAHKTDHPLKGKCFDYLGFETQEQLIQTLHNDGNLYFDSPSGRVYFACGVYSWDAEEMVQMLKMYMGNHLTLGPEWEEMKQAPEWGDAQNQP